MRNKYSKEFEETMKELAPTTTLSKLLWYAYSQFGYEISKEQLRQYLSKRKIRYKDYDKNRVRKMGKRYPIGSEYIKPDGMTLIKVAPNKWKYKQRLIYEQYHNVKLTSDDYIIFLDQDRNNFNIDNLARVSRRESSIIANMKKNKEKEVKKMNIWEKMRRKKGLTRVEIAREMGISEEKVKEVENNMREMPTKEVDKYIKNIHNMNNGEREITIAQARSWYEITDFKSLMKEFGFANQREVAKTIGVDPSSISVWFNKKKGSHEIGTNSLLKLYYFFNDEFNKKLPTEKVKTPTKRETMIKWWKGFDLKKAIATMGVKNQKDFSRKYNFPQSAVSDWSNKKATPQIDNLTRLYEIFNGKEETKVEEPINVSSSIVEPVSIEDPVFTPSDFNNIVYDNYYQYIPESEEPIYVEQPKEDKDIYTSTLNGTIEMLENENKKLRQQIARYETLIDLLINKEK